MTGSAALVESIERVPPLPVAVTKLLELESNPNRSLAMVGKLVELDPGLTAGVLKSANSAAAHPAQPIVSVTQAVTYLGERMVLALALATCHPGFLDPLEGYEADRGALWRHSLRTAVGARLLAAKCRRPLAADLAFTAGLLHDIGRLVLAAHLRGRGLLLSHAVDVHRYRDFVEAERDALGMSHCEVGASLAKRWKLPAPLEAAIGFHHDPARAPEPFQPLAYVIHIADLTAMMAGDGTGVDALAYPLAPDIAAHLDLDRRGLDSLMLRVEHEASAAALILGTKEDP